MCIFFKKSLEKTEQRMPDEYNDYYGVLDTHHESYFGHNSKLLRDVEYDLW
jgi:hypothetical protein